MGSIIDRALDIINDHLKDQASSFKVSSPLAQQAMAKGGEVLEDKYPSHYMPGVGRQVMARGGNPLPPVDPEMQSPPEPPVQPQMLDNEPPPMGHNMPPEPMEPVGAKMPMQGLHPKLISQRLPTAVKSKENPNEEALIVGLESAKQHPKSFEHNVDLVKSYDHMRPEEMQGTHDEVAENFINHLKDNYLFLHDMMPEELRSRAKKWYVGANKFSEKLAEDHGADPAASAAAIAAMSPQKDWFQNASLAERLFDIHHKHGDENYSHDMEMTANRIFGKEKFDELLDNVRGKTYNEIDDPRLKAIWARLYDETYHDPSHRLMTPEGVIGDWVTNQDGSHSRVSWGSTAEILKGIQALTQGATRENISELMGERHKIRNFYNNILDPHSPTQDVTVDTHAVAGGLLEPLGANATQVSHNFKNNVQDKSPASKGSAETGVQGTYPFYAEALRRAAAERGIEPREMQSITWEGLKGLFPDTFKTDKNIAAVREIWKDYAAGNVDIDEARKRIVKMAGGMNEPAWSRSAPVSDEGAPRSTYQRKLPKADVHGEPTAVDGGVGGTDSASVPRLEEQELRSFKRNRELTRASRKAFGQEALPQSFSRRTGRVGKNNLETDFDAPVRAVYDPTPEAQEAFSSAGISAPSMVELASGAKGANAFHRAITQSKETNPLAASVHAYDPKEYTGMRLFMTPNGKAGFALKGDDIVSVFNSRDSGHTHVSNAMLQLALAQGGRRLDAFDTALPHIYSRNRFKVAARMPWNEEYKPEGWNHSDFAAYNGGRPDVVFMHYDPTYDQLYDGRQGARAEDYDQAVKLQSAGVKKAEGVFAKLAKAKKPAKAYGGAINPPELHDDPEAMARRLILWSYAAAPLVRPLSRAEGGPVDDPDGKALDIARKYHPDAAQSSVSIARELSPQGFYSAAAEAARKIPQRAPLDQILNKVKGAPGVKAEELDRSGVKDAFAGQKSVDPKEVARHFQENIPQINEQTYGGAPIVHRAEEVDPETFFGDDTPSWHTASYIVGPKFKPAQQYVIHEAGRTRHAGDKPEYYLHGPKGDNLGDYDSLEAAEQAANDAMAGRDPVKYGEYALPGGERYREVVLHVPRQTDKVASNRVAQFAKDMREKYGERWSAMLTPEEGKQYDDLLDSHKDAPVFKSTHWPQDNVVAHLRMSDRAGQHGEKVLHVDEIQSDWGQKGREEGFHNGPTKQLSGEVVREEGPDDRWRVNWEDGSFSGGYGYEGAARARLNQGKTDEKAGIPTGPYVIDTNSWTDLALKRALKEAAEGGYDKMVWTPGAVQADRYNIVHSVKRLAFHPESKKLFATPIGQDEPIALSPSVNRDNLRQFVGKEVANKLLATEPQDGMHILEGDQLATNGEGMKKYYDSTVPNRLKKLVQQFDPAAKIEMFSHDLPLPDGGKAKGHALHITPKLREAILKGLPAYERGGSIISHAFKVVSRYS